MGRLAGKVAFITGAARGQGRSHAIRFAQEGASVIAIDVCEGLPPVQYARTTRADLDETVALVEKAGGRIVAAVADVRDLRAVEAAVRDGVSELGRLDIVAANAGIGARSFRVHELPADLWQEMLDINLTGVWNTVKATVPHLIAGGRGGSIIITSSGAGLKGYQNIGHYVAAKHGTVGLMRTLALELGQYRIRVNTVHPGNVNTDLVHNDRVYRLFRPDLENPTAEDFAARARELSVLPVPWVEPADVSNALVFLASDEARYITGVALPVDAGAAIK